MTTNVDMPCHIGTLCKVGQKCNGLEDCYTRHDSTKVFCIVVVVTLHPREHLLCLGRFLASCAIQSSDCSGSSFFGDCVSMLPACWTDTFCSPECVDSHCFLVERIVYTSHCGDSFYIMKRWRGSAGQDASGMMSC